LANGVRRFVARDGWGRALAWQKIDKSAWRIHRFDAALGERKAGDKVMVAYFRHDQLAEKRLTLGLMRKSAPKVVPVPNPTPAQTARFQR
jgi:predicted metalloprotease with PDZ domain